MLSTESTLVRAFTKRRTSNVVVVAPPPAPLPTHEAFIRRQAALRQMGLLPALSLSQQEAQLDSLIPPTSPVNHDSEADRIKKDWVAKNTDDLPPSPPLTPLSAQSAGDAKPEPELAIETSVLDLVSASAPLTPHSDTPPPINLILNPPPVCQPQLSHSPISDEFHPPESPALLHPLRSRSPSLAGSDSKSTRSRSRSKSRSRARSPLRFFIPPPQDPNPESDTPAPLPPQPQRKKTVFSRFKRANTVDTSSVFRHPQPPSRSKSLFTSVKKTVFGSLSAASPANNANNPEEISASITGGGGVAKEISTGMDANEEISASMDANPNTTPSPNLTLPTVSNESTTLATAPVTDPDSLLVVEENKPGAQQHEPAGSSAEVLPDLLLEFPSLGKRRQSESLSDDHDRGRSTGKGIGKGIGIGISLILNRERTKSASPSTPPASPLASSFLSSPPASPTASTTTGGRLRGRLGRKGTIGAGSEGLLSVWGGVTGLLGGASSVNGASISEEGGGGEGRQALAPTIHNQASILHHMSNIEDEETRRVTELAFM